MNFDNLMHNDLMTGLYRFMPFHFILLFGIWPHSLNFVIQCVKEFDIHSVETVSEVRKVKRENRDLCKTKNVIKR